MKKIRLELKQLLNKKILIFGFSGGLGKNVLQILKKKKFIIFKLIKSNKDFIKKNDEKKIYQYLKKINPDVIINCSGVLGDNLLSYVKVFNTNFGSNWEILKYYFTHKDKIKKAVKIIIVGSTAHKFGKKDYMLYAASKSALNNLCQGANEMLKNTNIDIKIYNPVRMNTPMIKNVNFIKKKGISPRIVAKKIIKLI